MVGDVPEDFPEAGFDLERHVEDITRAAIVRALKDPAMRRRMGEAGLVRANDRFTVERMVSETADVYARIASRPHIAGMESPPAV